MGDYTGLRFNAKLTEAAASALIGAMKLRFLGVETSFWEEVRRSIPVHKEFLAFRRKDFIPFGAICYMPPDWGDTRYIIDGRTWHVACSAKDVGYHPRSMMETFCEQVLPVLISEPCTAEILYEHWEQPKIVEITPRSNP